MVLLEMLWDDKVNGSKRERNLDRLRKTTTQPVHIIKGDKSNKVMPKSLTLPAVLSSGTPTTPSMPRMDDVWRSVFHPGNNIAARSIGSSNIFDKPNSPSVYDWVYSGESKSQHH